MAKCYLIDKRPRLLAEGDSESEIERNMQFKSIESIE